MSKSFGEAAASASERLRGSDLTRLRQLNELAVVQALRRRDPMTLTELARDTGLSRPSTEDVVRDLLDQRWVEEVAPATGTMGRPARRYRFRADAGRVLGIDIGGHTVRAVLADIDGAVVACERVQVASEAGRADRLAAIDEAVAKCLSAGGVTRTDVWAATAATSGLVDPAGRVMLSVALPEWTGVNVAEHVGRLVAGPVLVENDSKLAALAETWRGVARYARDVVFLLLGLRTGAGLIIDGKLHRGFANAAGEIGALPAIGWIRAQEHLQSWSKLAAGTELDEGAGLLFAAARAGDRNATAAVRRYVRDVAVGAAALVLALDPQVVVVGGGFSRSADVFLDQLRRELEKLCVRTPEVITSVLGDESVALGAVKLALDHLEQHVFDISAGLAAPAAPRR